MVNNLNESRSTEKSTNRPKRMEGYGGWKGGKGNEGNKLASIRPNALPPLIPPLPPRGVDPPDDGAARESMPLPPDWGGLDPAHAIGLADLPSRPPPVPDHWRSAGLLILIGESGPLLPPPPPLLLLQKAPTPPPLPWLLRCSLRRRHHTSQNVDSFPPSSFRSLFPLILFFAYKHKSAPLQPLSGNSSLALLEPFCSTLWV
jgi:hypothetical protein